MFKANIYFTQLYIDAIVTNNNIKMQFFAVFETTKPSCFEGTLSKN